MSHMIITVYASVTYELCFFLARKKVHPAIGMC